MEAATSDLQQSYKAKSENLTWIHVTLLHIVAGNRVKQLVQNDKRPLF